MTLLLIIICLAFLVLVILQIGRVSELAGRIRGEKDTQIQSNFWQARFGLVFLVLFLILAFGSAWYYKNWMLGYGPHTSASLGGERIDQIFNITLIVTGIVFVITQIALFWFAYKYRGRENRKAIFQSHDNKLELFWTIIPALVMAILVVYGLDVWGDVMADVDPDEEVINIEATGMQFAWLLRYPGEDNEFGRTNFRLIDGINPLGQDWTDEANHDDFQPTEIVLPVDKQVRVKIGSRDVLHSFFLPHFRVKMDAVPGMPTYFVFTPSVTTDEYRQRLSEYKNYQAPVDPNDPEGPKLWEEFNFELACAELCGDGHFSMRRPVRIVEEDEYNAWVKEQTSYYESTIMGSDSDPYKEENVKKMEAEELEDESMEIDSTSTSDVNQNQTEMNSDNESESLNQ